MGGDGGVGEAVDSDPTGDGTTELHPSWASFVERVVADVRTNFGSPVANEIAGVLDDHRAEEALPAAERREAAELVRDAVNNWRVARAEADAYADGARREAEHNADVVRREAEHDADVVRRAIEADRASASAELESLRTEIARLRSRMDELRTPLDAREAELVAWEVDLSERSAVLGAEAPTTIGSSPSLDGSDDQGHRARWASPAPPIPGAGRRGWGRRSRADDGKESPSR